MPVHVDPTATWPTPGADVTRCNDVVKELAKKIVSTSPNSPVARRTSSDDAKDPWTSDKASPCRPSLAASAVMIEVRVRRRTRRGALKNMDEPTTLRRNGETAFAISPDNADQGLRFGMPVVHRRRARTGCSGVPDAVQRVPGDAKHRPVRCAAEPGPLRKMNPGPAAHHLRAALHPGSDTVSSWSCRPARPS